MPSRWLLIAFALCALLAAFHLLAIDHFWYWLYPWSDVPMHMLGGAAIGACAIAFLGSYRPVGYLLIIAGAAVAWEVFEAVAGVAGVVGDNYVWDTALDILDDSIGAVLVYVIARFTTWKDSA